MARWDRLLTGRADDYARRAFLAGLGSVAPLFIATGLWGFVTGIAMVKAGMGTGMAVLMSLLVYAGSAQLTALPLLMTSAPLWLVFVAGFVVNIRFVIFGAAMQPFFRSLPWFRRFVAGYFNGDILFVMFMSRFGDARRKDTRFQHWYYAGMAAPAWCVWQVASIAGIYMSEIVPDAWSLGFAATLALLAVLVPLVKGRPMVLSVLVAGAVGWIGQLLPLRLGLVAAVLAGVVAGMLADRAIKGRAHQGAAK